MSVSDDFISLLVNVEMTSCKKQNHLMISCPVTFSENYEVAKTGDI